MRRPRLLIADDDAEIRAWLRLVLRPLRPSVAEAADGKELLEALESGSFDLVITDVRMPPPNGLEAAALARKEGVKTPFVFITAYSDESTRAAANALGQAIVIDKPFDADVFLERVRSLLSLSKGVDQ